MMSIALHLITPRHVMIRDLIFAITTNTTSQDQFPFRLRWKFRQSNRDSTPFHCLRPIHSSILQGGYGHPLAREWQAERTLTKSMLMYPIFITDDAEAEVVIPSLPGQKRWGVNKLEAFLDPLCKQGLRSVILFGVPLLCQKVSIILFLSFRANLSRMNVEVPPMTWMAQSYWLFRSCGSYSRNFISRRMFVFANIPHTGTVVY